jgi:hypothetical protein
LRLILTVLNVDDKIIQKALELGFNDFEDAVQSHAVAPAHFVRPANATHLLIRTAKTS